VHQVPAQGDVVARRPVEPGRPPVLMRMERGQQRQRPRVLRVGLDQPAQAGLGAARGLVVAAALDAKAGGLALDAAQPVHGHALPGLETRVVIAPPMGEATVAPSRAAISPSPCSPGAPSSASACTTWPL